MQTDEPVPKTTAHHVYLGRFEALADLVAECWQTR